MIFVSIKRSLMCFLLVMGMSFMVHAQNSNDAREVTSAYYIKNAFVVQKPGKVLTNHSIVVRDGMIESVGANIKVPYDAIVIDADSMYVYAGFIDACSHAGIKAKEQKDRPRVNNPGNPPKELAGITPQNSVRDAIEKIGKSMTALKDLGFGYVHVVPRGRMMPGMGSVLSTSGNSVERSLIKENISQYAQFKPARGVFPATTIGVMSQFRDLMINAKNSNAYGNKYKSNPFGLKRPNQSEELEALYAAANGKMPVFFYTPKVKDINRAMILNNELGYDLVLTGVRQGWPLIDDIVTKNHKVVLSLWLPEEIKEEDDKKEKDSKNTEIILLKEKKKKSHDTYVAQAATFEKKNIPFSFSTLDVKSKDLKPNLLRMVAGGLSENGALAALTINPAKLLGISDMAGSVEKGKIANIFITDKSYFDKESKIKFVFSDGMMKETKEKKKSKNDDNVALQGKWSYEVAIPGQTQTGTIDINGEGDDMTLTLVSSDDPTEEVMGKNITQDGSTLMFDIDVDGMKFNISVEIEGDEFEGTVSAKEMGSFPMTGTKKPE